MKLKDSEKSLLIVLFGVAVLILSGLYIVRPNYEKIQSLNVECQQLRDRLAYLQQQEAHRDEFIAETAEYNEKFDAIMSAFAPDLNQEVSVMFLEGIRDNNDFDIANVSLGEKEAFYTLGMGAGDGVLQDTTTDAAATDAAASDGQLVEGNAATDDNQYECYRAEFPMSYTGQYTDIKNVVNYVDNFSQRMTIDSVDIAYDAEEKAYSGNMNLVWYSIEGPDRAETTMELNDVEIGVDNIFLGGNASASADSEKLTKYNDNEGATIVNNYDFYAMLNPSSSDVSAKVLGQNGSGKEASVISNSDNSVSTVNFDFYEQDGKNYCKYTLDNSTSYEAEVTSAEDIKILLQSSARKNSDDKVGIRVTIRNTTTLPVYVKVNGDDSVSPRVSVTSQTGAVKVY